MDNISAIMQPGQCSRKFCRRVFMLILLVKALRNSLIFFKMWFSFQCCLYVYVKTSGRFVQKLIVLNKVCLIATIKISLGNKVGVDYLFYWRWTTLYWYYYNTSNMTTYYASCSSITATDFAEVVSRMVDKRLTASDIPKANRQSDLDKMPNVTHI